MQRGALAARARRKLNNAWQELAQVTRPAETPPVQAADLIDYADQLPPHRQRLIESHHQAAAAYTAGPYQGPVLLLLAQVQPLFSTSDAAAQWRRLASDQLQVRTVPGSHEGMFHEPHVQQLARHIRQAMKRGAV
jgi:thioesterase domain-containing protein